MNDTNAKIKLTGLWKQESKDGESYLAGKISPSMRLMIFPNQFKKTDADPDYVAYMTPAADQAEGPAKRSTFL
jgi:hypothetical protein